MQRPLFNAMDLQRIKELIALVEDSSIDEIEIHEGDQSVRIVQRRAQPLGQAQLAPLMAPVGAALPAGYPSPGAPSPPLATGLTASPEGAPPAEGHTVTAPMVGIFYGAPSPTAQPFVTHGQKISEGDTLCIIEAMKIMNQINAEVSGVVRKVLVESGQPVEYDQPLIIIDG